MIVGKRKGSAISKSKFRDQDHIGLEPTEVKTIPGSSPHLSKDIWGLSPDMDLLTEKKKHSHDCHKRPLMVSYLRFLCSFVLLELNKV